MNSIKISIIITSYNYEQYIERCIISCLNQKDYDDYEVIVVDDGSKDNTSKILEKYKNRLRYYLNENHGIEYTANFGIKHALGKYILRVDADDMLTENCLKNLASSINDDNGFVYSDYFTIDSNNTIKEHIKLPDFDANEIRQRGDFLATGTLYIKNIVTYNESSKNCGLENYELILKLLNSNIKGFHVAMPLFYYRHHSRNISNLRKKEILKYGESISKRFNLEKYQTNEFHPWGLIL